jgi:hypothetical protein
MHRLIHAASLALAVASLGSVAGCDDASPAPEVHVSGFSPADGATRVDIRPTLSIAFDGPLDPASVSAAHVTVTITGFTIPATIAYDDATHTITVRPRTLDHARTYTLAVSGLANTSGRPVGEAHATFKTWINAVLRSPSGGVQTLDDAGNVVRDASVDADGNVTAYTDHTYAGGLLTRRTSYVGPGPDGTWFTADDDLLMQFLYEYDAHGALTSRSLLRARGPIGGGGPDERYDYQYDATGKVSILKVTDGNADGDAALGTADDLVGYTRFTYDASGRQVLAYHSAGPGADGIQFTQDDIVGADILVPGTDGALDLLGVYESPGPDGQWLTTADDTLSFSYQKQRLDARGNVVRLEEYGPTGPISETGLVDTIDYVYDEHDNLVTATQVYTEDGLPNVTSYDTAN